MPLTSDAAKANVIMVKLDYDALNTHQNHHRNNSREMRPASYNSPPVDLQAKYKGREVPNISLAGKPLPGPSSLQHASHKASVSYGQFRNGKLSEIFGDVSSQNFKQIDSSKFSNSGFDRSPMLGPQNQTLKFME